MFKRLLKAWREVRLLWVVLAPILLLSYLVAFLFLRLGFDEVQKANVALERQNLSRLVAVHGGTFTRERRQAVVDLLADQPYVVAALYAVEHRGTQTMEKHMLYVNGRTGPSGYLAQQDWGIVDVGIEAFELKQANRLQDKELEHLLGVYLDPSHAVYIFIGDSDYQKVIANEEMSERGMVTLLNRVIFNGLTTEQIQDLEDRFNQLDPQLYVQIQPFDVASYWPSLLSFLLYLGIVILIVGFLHHLVAQMVTRRLVAHQFLNLVYHLGQGEGLVRRLHWALILLLVLPPFLLASGLMRVNLIYQILPASYFYGVAITLGLFCLIFCRALVRSVYRKWRRNQ